MILTAGLTGGIASGKSTIARIFAELGCISIDADDVVAELYRPGHAGHEVLLQTYGPAIQRPDGEIDRPRLADVAFATVAEAQRLNALIHPLVIEEEQRMIAALAAADPGSDRIVVIEATLMIESGGRTRYDRIVVVDVPPEVQLARAMSRGMARSDVERRIARQMPRQERLRFADYVIDNSGDEAAARAATQAVHAKLLRDLRDKKTRNLKPET